MSKTGKRQTPSVFCSICKMKVKLNIVVWCCLYLLPDGLVLAQERDQDQYWLDLAATDQTYADRSNEIGRTRAFREFLGEGSICLLYTSPSPRDRG